MKNYLKFVYSFTMKFQENTIIANFFSCNLYANIFNFNYNLKK